MSGTLTVIGGHSSTQGLTGLVTIPSGFTGNIVSSLQSLLTAASGAVSTGSANFENLDVAGQSGGVNATVGAFGSGILVASNFTSGNTQTAGTANVSVGVPTGCNTVVVQAPGKETVSGNATSGFLGVFGANSTVNFNSGGGSGTVAALASGDSIYVSGGNWSVSGGASGNDSIAVNVTGSATVATYGSGNAVNNAGGANPTPSNVVGLGTGNVTVNSDGLNDLIDSYGGNDVVTLSNSGHVLVSGANDTVYAAAGSTDVQAFFEIGGTLDFINQSSGGATVSGDVPGATGGGDTTFGGAGGGEYIGGSGGNNSLVGGSGSVTLVGAGSNNYMQAGGSNNALFASSGATTMVGAAGSGANQFSGSTGSLVVSTSGSGSQAFFVGTSGQEILSGSTVSGATNSYYFLQDSTGSGSDVVQNFRVGTDHLYVNPFGAASASGVDISQILAINSTTSHPGGGALVLLSDNTTITLYGVSASAIQADAGGKSI